MTCRWGAGHLSDAPELTVLTRLGEFVKHPGKPPSEQVREVECQLTTGTSHG